MKRFRRMVFSIALLLNMPLLVAMETLQLSFEPGIPITQILPLGVMAKPILAMNLNADSLTLLHVAAKSGDLEYMRQHLHKNINVNVYDQEKYPATQCTVKGIWTPLHCAVAKGDLKIAELLLESGADVNACFRSGQTPLYCAIVMEDVVMVEWLIKKGAKVGFLKDTNGNTPLHFAVATQCIDIVRLLLACEDSFFLHRSANYRGETPLEVAQIYENSLDVITILQEHMSKKEQDWDERICCW